MQVAIGRCVTICELARERRADPVQHRGSGIRSLACANSPGPDRVGRVVVRSYLRGSASRFCNFRALIFPYRGIKFYLSDFNQ
jgi:hypothetical protein